MADVWPGAPIELVATPFAPNVPVPQAHDAGSIRVCVADRRPVAVAALATPYVLHVSPLRVLLTRHTGRFLFCRFDLIAAVLVVLVLMMSLTPQFHRHLNIDRTRNRLFVATFSSLLSERHCRLTGGDLVRVLLTSKKIHV